MSTEKIEWRVVLQNRENPDARQVHGFGEDEHAAVEYAERFRTAIDFEALIERRTVTPWEHESAVDVARRIGHLTSQRTGA